MIESGREIQSRAFFFLFARCALDGSETGKTIKTMSSSRPGSATSEASRHRWASSPAGGAASSAAASAVRLRPMLRLQLMVSASKERLSASTTVTNDVSAQVPSSSRGHDALQPLREAFLGLPSSLSSLLKIPPPSSSAPLEEWCVATFRAMRSATFAAVPPEDVASPRDGLIGGDHVSSSGRPPSGHRQKKPHSLTSSSSVRLRNASWDDECPSVTFPAAEFSSPPSHCLVVARRSMVPADERRRKSHVAAAVVESAWCRSHDGRGGGPGSVNDDGRGTPVLASVDALCRWLVQLGPTLLTYDAWRVAGVLDGDAVQRIDLPDGGLGQDAAAAVPAAVGCTEKDLRVCLPKVVLAPGSATLRVKGHAVGAPDFPTDSRPVGSWCIAAAAPSPGVAAMSPPPLPCRTRVANQPFTDADVFQLLYMQLLALGTAASWLPMLSQVVVAVGTLDDGGGSCPAAVASEAAFDASCFVSRPSQRSGEGRWEGGRVGVGCGAEGGYWEDDEPIGGAPTMAAALAFKWSRDTEGYGRRAETAAAGTRDRNGPVPPPGCMCVCFDAAAPTLFPSATCTLIPVDDAAWGSAPCTVLPRVASRLVRDDTHPPRLSGSTTTTPAAAAATSTTTPFPIGSVPCVTRLGSTALRWAQARVLSCAADALSSAMPELFNLFDIYRCLLSDLARLCPTPRVFRISPAALRAFAKQVPSQWCPWLHALAAGQHVPSPPPPRGGLAIASQPNDDASSSRHPSAAAVTPVATKMTGRRSDDSTVDVGSRDDDFLSTFSRYAKSPRSEWRRCFYVDHFDAVGVTLGPLIGSGGSGVVFRGIFEPRGRNIPVAVKCFVIPDRMAVDDYVAECLTDSAFLGIGNVLEIAGIWPACRVWKFFACSVFPAEVRQTEWFRRCIHHFKPQEEATLCFHVMDLVEGTLGRFLKPGDPDYDDAYDTIVNTPLTAVEAFQWVYWQLALRVAADWVVDDLLLQQQVRGDNIGWLSVPAFLNSRLAAQSPMVQQAEGGGPTRDAASASPTSVCFRFIGPTKPLPGNAADRGSASAMSKDDRSRQQMDFLVETKGGERCPRVLQLIDVGQGRQPWCLKLAESKHIGNPIVDSCVIDDGFGRFYDSRYLLTEALSPADAGAKAIFDWAKEQRVGTSGSDAGNTLVAFFTWAAAQREVLGATQSASDVALVSAIITSSVEPVAVQGFTDHFRKWLS